MVVIGLIIINTVLVFFTNYQPINLILTVTSAIWFVELVIRAISFNISSWIVTALEVTDGIIILLSIADSTLCLMASNGDYERLRQIGLAMRGLRLL